MVSPLWSPMVRRIGKARYGQVSSYTVEAPSIMKGAHRSAYSTATQLVMWHPLDSASARHMRLSVHWISFLDANAIHWLRLHELAHVEAVIVPHAILHAPPAGDLLRLRVCAAHLPHAEAEPGVEPHLLRAALEVAGLAR